MSNQSSGKGSGILSLFFREAGLFSEQAWQWANERATETSKFLEERARETGKYIEGRTREGQQFVEDQVKQERVLSAESEKRNLAEAQIRKTDAEARLLEQIRLAKAAGLDVDSIIRRIRDEAR
jgi:hypothetical protein